MDKVFLKEAMYGRSLITISTVVFYLLHVLRSGTKTTMEAQERVVCADKRLQSAGSFEEIVKNSLKKKLLNESLWYRILNLRFFRE